MMEWSDPQDVEDNVSLREVGKEEKISICWCTRQRAITATESLTDLCLCLPMLFHCDQPYYVWFKLYSWSYVICNLTVVFLPHFPHNISTSLCGTTFFWKPWEREGWLGRKGLEGPFGPIVFHHKDGKRRQQQSIKNQLLQRGFMKPAWAASTEFNWGNIFCLHFCSRPLSSCDMHESYMP